MGHMTVAEGSGLPGKAAQASWLELDAAAVRKNAAMFRELMSAEGRRPTLGTVLKGNAYGHGFAPMLELVHPEYDCIFAIDPYDALAVRELERRAGKPAKQVVVTGAVGGEEAVELARHGIDIVLADLSWSGIAEQLRSAKPGRRARVHVFVDTGLGREGFAADEVPAVVELLRKNADVLEPVGAMSHFANTEDVTEQSYAQWQLDNFERGVATLKAGFPEAMLQRHFAASAATLVLPPSRFEAVRVGIGTYGLWPSSETRLSSRVSLGRPVTLTPVLSWRCKSQLVKWLPAGSSVGYGCTYRCEQRTRVAVLPMGYFDGYPRLASGRAHVLVKGQRCQVLGRVSMNHLVIDVTRIPESPEPVTATLIGHDGNANVTAEMLADWAQTISYEIVTRIGSHLRRTVVGR